MRLQINCSTSRVRGADNVLCVLFGEDLQRGDVLEVAHGKGTRFTDQRFRQAQPRPPSRTSRAIQNVVGPRHSRLSCTQPDATRQKPGAGTAVSLSTRGAERRETNGGSSGCAWRHSIMLITSSAATIASCRKVVR